MTAPQEPRALDDLAGRPVLVVSPHLDDAALSAFALLRVAEQPPTVLTVFDGVPVRPLVRSWDLVCGFRDSTEAMRTRRAENAEAMDRLGCVHLSLGLLDSSTCRVTAGRRMRNGCERRCGPGQEAIPAPWSRFRLARVCRPRGTPRRQRR